MKPCGLAVFLTVAGIMLVGCRLTTETQEEQCYRASKAFNESINIGEAAFTAAILWKQKACADLLPEHKKK